MNNTASLILAAGNGSRMKSKHPKVLCDLLFKPMLQWVLECCTQMEIPHLCVVDAPEQPLVAFLPPEVETALQKERLGTGHAVMAAGDFLYRNRDRDILILFGDSPFMKPEDLTAALQLHRSGQHALTLISAMVEQPFGYGRILRQGERFCRIVEQRDTDTQTALIQEVNSGALWAKGEQLLSLLPLIRNQNTQQEYYLTDIAGLAVSRGDSVGVYTVSDPVSVLGANHRKALAELNEIARVQVLDRLYEQGVHIPFPQTVVVGTDVVVGRDTTLLPGTLLRGHTQIGEDCLIGENTTIDSCIIGKGCTIQSSVLEQSQVGDHTKIGPFAHLRPHSVLSSHVKVGNFVEIKNSQIGTRTSVAHLSYLGDSTVGQLVNVGCGVVTANYDGEKKHATILGDGVFVGCNTNLIAPVTVGDGAVIAAGSTITEEVPPFALAIARSRQITLPQWAKTKGKYRKVFPNG